jgi:hypothetical protein
MQGEMGGRHRCPLCDWARDAAHATVVDPFCPRCGGVLEHERDGAGGGSAPAIVLPGPVAALARSRRLEWALLALVVLPLVLAATKVGWDLGGAAVGVLAFVVAALAAYVIVTPGTSRG